MNSSKTNIFTFSANTDSAQCLSPHCAPEPDANLRLKALCEIGEQIIKVQPLNQVFGVFHQILKKVLFADNMLIALYNSDRSHIHLPYFVDTVDKQSALIGSMPAREYIESTLVGYVFRRKQALLANSGKLQRLKASGAINFPGSQSASWLGIPLVFQNEVIGVLAVQSYDAAKLYTQADQIFLQHACNPLTGLIGFHQAQVAQQAYVEQLEELVDWQMDELKQVSKKIVTLEAIEPKPPQAS